MKFNRIVCVDHAKLNDKTIKQLDQYSDTKVEVYSDYPETDEEIIRRIEDAEAVIVSWRTQLHKEIIDACPKLKYIGMACSLFDDESANVAVKHAREKGITVKGIFDYGDPGVAEFIISELIQFLNGYKGPQWKETPLELTDLKIGITGLGVTGKLLADCLLPFGADLYYHSRTRKKDFEAKGVKFLKFEDLLQKCEVLSFHLPKNTCVMEEDHFKAFNQPKILINTSLGLPFEPEAFVEWVQIEGNYAIFDADGKSDLKDEVLNLPQVLASKKSAGWSAQTHVRLSQKVLQNLSEFCKENQQ
ncbi:NAD(P)-dependent oxidoreductase [Christiangramia aquimixticola]|uniref:NAD(P)-dependent oxidoreductase n=1 Tax=Christiangramia aquimixticola TaxID=1697558 RepID=UPI003AA849A0